MIQFLVVALSLAWASWEDLKTQRVKDKVFLVPLLLVVVLGGVQSGPAHAGSMLVQAFVMALMGFGVRLVSKFGGADILAVALAGSVFPNILGFRVMAFLLVPMLFWLKIWQVISNSREGPAIPGILIGYLILLSTVI
jgi:Flp pilus assembly protein protease CpaA